MNSFDPTLVRLVINLIGAVSARRRCGAQDCQRHLAPDLCGRTLKKFDLRLVPLEHEAVHEFSKAVVLVIPGRRRSPANPIVPAPRLWIPDSPLRGDPE